MSEGTAPEPAAAEQHGPVGSAYATITRLLTRAIFGESATLQRVGMRGMPNRSRAWYAVAGGVAHLLFRGVLRWDLVGFDRIPRDRGVIIASNHLSSGDPAMLAAALYPRWPKYMAKVELFRKRPGFGYLFALSGAFPVRRFDADMGALREAERQLAAAELVGMFPEGHRSDTGALIEAHPGTALLALRSGAPVVPVGITGSEQLRGGWRALLRRPRVRILIGDPFELARPQRINREAVAIAQERLMREIAARLPEDYRGFYEEQFADLGPEARIEAPGPEPASAERP